MVEESNRYTILLCRYTGKVGLVRKSAMRQKKVLICTGRSPITYLPVVTRDTITLGWVLARSMDAAFLKVPQSLWDIREGNK